MRLTYKYEKCSGYGSVRLKNLPADPFVDKLSYLDNAWEEQRNKLGQLEDIEEELGIDLITFLKIFVQENIYIKCNGEIFTSDVEFAINCDKKGYFINLEICQFDRLYLKDYGKTWALTKEELE